MASKARRRITTSSRQIGPKRWTAAVVTGTEGLGAGYTATDLLVPADYTLGNLQGKGRLDAVYFSFSAFTGNSIACNYAAMGILAINAEVSSTVGTANDPDDPNALSDERWLYNEHFQLPGSTQNYAHVSKGLIRQKVNLSDMDLRFSISNQDALATIDYVFSARILITMK